MSIHFVDFFPKYPLLPSRNDEKEDPLFATYGNERFEDVIQRKREFNELRLDMDEKFPTNKGDLFKHQELIARFMSGFTPYDQLLVFHEMGTGKTCTSIAVAERLKNEKKTSFVGTLVFAKGKGILNNFKSELLFKCTDGRYIPQGFSNLSDKQKKERLKQSIKSFYRFFTFQKFASLMKQQTDYQIKTAFSNHVIIIDEVHNLRLKPEKFDKFANLDIYDQFHRFLHIVKNCKILLMSGTPMKDQVAEIVPIMNLILPINQQFSTQFFEKNFIQDDGRVNKQKIVEFQKKIVGRVSYLKSMRSSVPKIFVGSLVGKLKFFNVFQTYMSEFQSQAYTKAFEEENEKSSFKILAQQASLFVFPDGSFGSKGFGMFIQSTANGKFRMTQPLITALDNNRQLQKFSCKFATLLSFLEKGQKTFCYLKFIHGSGSILLSLILKMSNYVQVDGKNFPQTFGKRFIIVNNGTPDIEKLIDMFNDPRNVNGEYIQVLIGSKVISEGFTLKNLSYVINLSPHWNYSETAQANARGWRLGSHEGSPEGSTLQIVQMVAMPHRSNVKSIDLLMYEISEEKDVPMKAVEFAMKVAAFDCGLMKKRNFIQGYDNMRECDFQKCEYSCIFENYDEDKAIDDLTYNLYYSKEKQITDYLKKLFQTSSRIKLQYIVESFQNNFTPFEVYETLDNLISNNVLLNDKFGNSLFLRSDKNTIFLSTQFNHKVDLLSCYYSENLIVNLTPVDFKTTVTFFKQKFAVEKVNELFQFPNLTNEILNTFETPVLVEIAKAAILANHLKKTKNADIREKILAFFRSDIRDSNNSIVLTLVNPPICFNLTDLTWSECHNNDTVDNSHVVNPELLQSPIGFYGMVNPKRNDEFCLREIKDFDIDENLKKDRRKMTVGKRCKDFSHLTLTDIVANRIKQDIKNPKYLEKTTRQFLIKKATELGLQTILPVNASIEDLKRIIFWKTNSRENLCWIIKKWMYEKNLIEENAECGTQNKKRKKLINSL